MIMYVRISIASIPAQLYKILPYVVTTIVLVISSMRNNKEKQPPASLDSTISERIDKGNGYGLFCSTVENGELLW